jgi:hypothetical protein
MSSSKQRPLLPPQTLSAFLELRSSISSNSLQNCRAAAGEEQEKKIASILRRRRFGLSLIRARMGRPNLFPLSPIGCSTRQGGHNFSHRSRFGSAQCLPRKSAAEKIVCAALPVSSIEIPKSDVRDAVLPAVRHPIRRVKNMRGLYV